MRQSTVVIRNYVAYYATGSATRLSRAGARFFATGIILGTDRTTGAIALAWAHDRGAMPIRGIGVQNLKRFEKYRVDRLGRLYKVRREKRQ